MALVDKLGIVKIASDRPCFFQFGAELDCRRKRIEALLIWQHAQLDVPCGGQFAPQLGRAHTFVDERETQ